MSFFDFLDPIGLLGGGDSGGGSGNSGVGNSQTSSKTDTTSSNMSGGTAISAAPGVTTLSGVTTGGGALTLTDQGAINRAFNLADAAFHSVDSVLSSSSFQGLSGPSQPVPFNSQTPASINSAASYLPTVGTIAAITGVLVWLFLRKK